jgi:hypothetical protein
MSAAPMFDVAERETRARFPAIDNRGLGTHASLTAAA